jgi:arylsulfatase A-like enzyme
VNEHVRRLYAGDVRRVDDAVGQLLGWIFRELGEDWLVVFTADHGESLGEHDFYFDHGEYIYNPSLRVPLAFVFPEGDPLEGPGRSDAWVSLVDVFPTLAELLALPCDAAAGCRRRAAPGSAAARRAPAPPLYAEQAQPPELVRRRVRADVSGRFRVVDGGWKLIWTPGRDGAPCELFDLEADPERRDLSPERGAQRLAALLRAFGAEGRPSRPHPARPTRGAARARLHRGRGAKPAAPPR